MKIRFGSILVVAAAQAMAAGPGEEGRQFDRLSIHPNGREWLLGECVSTLDEKGDCFVLHYDAVSRELGRYELPQGYYYHNAAYGPSGRYIVMTRIPKPTVAAPFDEETVQRSREAVEVALMKADGSDFHVLPLAPGYKVAPAISPDDSKLAFWRGVQRPAGSKTLAHRHDLREADLDGKREHLFAGEYGFFEGGRLQYLDGVTLLVNASYPTNDPEFAAALEKLGGHPAYEAQYGTSRVYQLARGHDGPVHPSFAGLSHAANATATARKEVFLVADIPGTSIVRMSGDSVEKWPLPSNFPLSGFNWVASTPDGSKVYFIYSRSNAAGARERALGQLDTQTGRWSTLTVPPANQGKALPVQSRHQPWP